MPSMNEAAFVRAAVAGDIDAVCAIHNAAIAERGSTFETDPRSPRDFSGRIENAEFPLLVGVVGANVVGWAGLAPYSSRECYAGIGEASVYVDAAARGRGLGTALTAALAGAAEDLGFHKLIGKLFTDNAASIRLVERCGFSSVGLHRRHGQLDGAWRDVLVVERLLDPASTISDGEHHRESALASQRLERRRRASGQTGSCSATGSQQP
jgi:L-amino acid N-acyltransferase YncA